MCVEGIELECPFSAISVLFSISVKSSNDEVLLNLIIGVTDINREVNWNSSRSSSFFRLLKR